MNSFHKKIQAFSIIELVIAMVIAGIVISLAGMVFLRTYRTLGIIRQEKQYETRVMFLNNLLRTDFDKSRKVIRDPDGSLKFYHYKGIKSAWEITDEYIVRQGLLKTDTFFVHHGEIMYHELPNGNQQVNGINMEITGGKQVYRLEYFKAYTSAEKFYIKP